MAACQRIKGCTRGAHHDGACEVGRIPRNHVPLSDISKAVTFLDGQQQVTQMAAKVHEELLIVVGANNAMFDGGLTRDALIHLITAKCRNASNGKPVSEATVEIVLDAMARLGEYLK